MPERNSPGCTTCTCSVGDVSPGSPVDAPGAAVGGVVVAGVVTKLDGLISTSVPSDESSSPPHAASATTSRTGAPKPANPNERLTDLDIGRSVVVTMPRLAACRASTDAY